ncbi:hypothetical protein D3C76_1394140 [compost metagenome]
MVTALGVAGGIKMRGILHRQSRKVVDMAHREVLQKLADNGFGTPSGTEHKAHFAGQYLDVLNRLVPGQAQHQGIQLAFPGRLNTAGQFLVQRLVQCVASAAYAGFQRDIG